MTNNPNPNCKNCAGVGSPNLLGETVACGLCWSYGYQNSTEVPTRAELIEMLVGLQAALSIRNECGDCGGRGIDWVHVGGEAEPEPCDCVDFANEVLERYKERFAVIVDEYLWLNGIDVRMLEDKWHDIAYELLELTGVSK